MACAREIHSSNTESVVSEFAALLKSYRVTTVYGDRYGQSWVIDAFARHGIILIYSQYDRIALYLNLFLRCVRGRQRFWTCLDLGRNSLP